MSSVPSSGSSPRDAYCELSFSPNADLIPTVRRFMQDFYLRVIEDADITSHIVIATHELLDNAVKYSSDQQSSIRVSVSKESAGVRVIITTTNRASDEHLAELRSLLDEMKSGEERAIYYRKVMKRSAKRTIGSGLGLARLYAESEMALGVTVDDETSQVQLRAEGFYPYVAGGVQGS